MITQDIAAELTQRLAEVYDRLPVGGAGPDAGAGAGATNTITYSGELPLAQGVNFG